MWPSGKAARMLSILFLEPWAQRRNKNVRDSDDSVLGVVGDRYKVVQNIDAFKFTDDLIGGDVRYETAGSLRDGKQVFQLRSMADEL